MTSANIAARLEERARRHPERVAIIEGRGRRRRAIGFGELADRMARLGAGLRERGLETGDRALLFVPMSIDLYTALLAVLHVGGVAVFLDAWADRKRLEAAVAAADPRALIATPRAHLLRLVSRGIRRVPLRMIAGRGPWSLDRAAAPRAVHGAELSPAGDRGELSAAALQPAMVGPDAHALVTFTTGSTGRPKAAARSHGFLWAQHEVLARHLGLRETDVDMPTLPVFVLNNLALGVTTVLPRFDPRRPARIRPAAIERQMREEGVTTTSGSPAFYDRLVRHGRIPVRALFTGGAPVFPPLADRLARATRGEVVVLYGSTEAEPIAHIPAKELVAAGRDPETEGVCAGRPIPEIELRLIRPADGPVALGAGGWREWEVGRGEVGEVVVAGKHVLTGYLDDPEAEALAKIRERTPEGVRVWHRTGDAARVDEAGRLWLMGRVGQRVERDGRTWWPMAAEARALGVEGVVHAAYLGYGGHAVLCVEPAGGTRGGLDRLRQDLPAALSPIPVDRILVLDRIPRDPRHASKTDMVRLLERIEPEIGSRRAVSP